MEPRLYIRPRVSVRCASGITAPLMLVADKTGSKTFNSHVPGSQQCLSTRHVLQATASLWVYTRLID